MHIRRLRPQQATEAGCECSGFAGDCFHSLSTIDACWSGTRSAGQSDLSSRHCNLATEAPHLAPSAAKSSTERSVSVLAFPVPCQGSIFTALPCPGATPTGCPELSGAKCFGKRLEPYPGVHPVRSSVMYAL